jgi:predicted anti-sigma-YlaC factor YlaD
MKISRPILLLLPLALVLAGCSVNKLAGRALGKALAGSGTVFASDDDPELIGQALPFALKTVEALLAGDPKNRDLLLFACQGFTQYGFAFVQMPGDEIGRRDYDAAQVFRQRALNLYLRARGYCLRGLDVMSPGAPELILRDPRAALAGAKKSDVPLLYWTAGSWGSAIAVGSNRPELVVDWPVVRALLERALELDPDFDRGALHEGMVQLEGLPEVMGGSVERARKHFDRALELSKGERAGPYVTWAATISTRLQNVKEFDEMIGKALKINVHRFPADRLANILQQRRARFLLAKKGELFLDLESQNSQESP